MFSFAPLGPLADAARKKVLESSQAAGCDLTLVAMKFEEVVRLFDRTTLGYREREECIQRLAEMFIKYMDARCGDSLLALDMSRSVERPDVPNRFAAGSLVASLLGGPGARGPCEYDFKLIALNALQDLFFIPLQPTEHGVSELHSFLKLAPDMHQRLSRIEEMLAARTEEGEAWNSARFWYRVREAIGCSLRLVLENNMPTSVAISATEAMAHINSRPYRYEIGDRWRLFVNNWVCRTRLDDVRLPEPLGRAGVVGAVKSPYRERRSASFGASNTLQQVSVEMPSSVSAWQYFGQRLTHLLNVKDPVRREERLYRYFVSFTEFAAARPFFAKEERFYRMMNLDGRDSYEARGFYRDTYGVDNGPGAARSRASEEPLNETEKVFRYVAAARYGLNVRKGYARALDDGRWLLESMAYELKGESQRYRVAERDAYPGPGVRLFGLDIRNALDLSDSASRMRHLRASPWIASSMRAGSEVEYHLFRGFKAITRSLDVAARPMSSVWGERGCLQGEPYSLLIFNDHFHNDNLPEVRAWLVPERVLHRKLVFAIENNVDVNRLDVTPEGIAEEAEALGLIIFDVGCSDVRWAGFGNSWPFGTGPGREWERKSHWGVTPWQSPRHIHLALRGNSYSQNLSEPVARAMIQSRIQHDSIKKVVQFFLDLHSSFLTMEEGWAKGHASNNEPPPREVSMQLPSREQGGGEDELQEAQEGEDDLEDDGGLDFTAARPRTRMLQHFIDLRNQLVESGQRLAYMDFPVLDLQYTRLFSRQFDVDPSSGKPRFTPSINGADMMMTFHDGRQISLLSGRKFPGVVHGYPVALDERMEAIWEEHFASLFAPNNCPRIFLP